MTTTCRIYRQGRTEQITDSLRMRFFWLYSNGGTREVRLRRNTKKVEVTFRACSHIKGKNGGMAGTTGSVGAEAADGDSIPA